MSVRSDEVTSDTSPERARRRRFMTSFGRRRARGSGGAHHGGRQLNPATPLLVGQQMVPGQPDTLPDVIAVARHPSAG